MLHSQSMNDPLRLLMKYPLRLLHQNGCLLTNPLGPLTLDSAILLLTLYSYNSTLPVGMRGGLLMSEIVQVQVCCECMHASLNQHRSNC